MFLILLLTARLPSESKPASPVEHRAVKLSVYRQVSPLVGKLRAESLVIVDAQPHRIPWMQIAVLERVRVRKNFISFPRMTHVFLNSEIVDGNVEMQGSRHGHRRKVSRSVAAGAHVINL